MCEIRIEDGVRAAQSCKCYQAVMRAYSAMIGAGQPPNIAQDVAITVYSYHHPQDTKANQSLTVERWLNEGHLH